MKKKLCNQHVLIFNFFTSNGPIANQSVALGFTGIYETFEYGNAAIQGREITRERTDDHNVRLSLDVVAPYSTSKEVIASYFTGARKVAYKTMLGTSPCGKASLKAERSWNGETDSSEESVNRDVANTKADLAGPGSIDLNTNKASKQ